MKYAAGYVQVVPVWRGTPGGNLKELKLGNLTQTYPRSPEPGAFVVRVVLEVDERIFEAPILQLRLTGEPSELASAIVPVPVPAEEVAE